MTEIEKQYFIAGLAIFCIYSFITFLGIVSYLKRELYVFQECDYKISGYVRQTKKNYRRYIFPFVLFVGQIIMLATGDEEIYYNDVLELLFLICNIIIAFVNRPFRKRLQNTDRTRKITITFFILTAIIFIISLFRGYDESWGRWFCNVIPFFIVNFALYLTPLLVCLADILNKPFYSIKKYKEII